MKQFTQKHLLGIKDITVDDIELIFETADGFKTVINRPIKKGPSLRDVTIANIFFENSTRTRISFELAQKRLSADTVNFAASSSSVSKGETLIDTVNNILAMKVDMVVMRHPAPGAAVVPDGHLSVDARRVRGEHPGHLRHHSRARWSGLHGRRQHERAGRPDQPGRDRR